MTIRKTLEFIEKSLHFAESPRAEAEWILSFILKISRSELFLVQKELEKPELDQIDFILEQRKERKPLQWILGETEFFGLKLKIAPGVLIPRPETELLVDLVLRNLDESPKKVIDIGCGSGAIALVLKKYRPNWTVLATDISTSAIKLTQENAKILDLNLQIELVSLTNGFDSFDLIISNPPYLPENDILPPEVSFEPKEALFSGQDGLNLARQIVKSAKRSLKIGGLLALELDPRNVNLLADELGTNSSWKIEKDLNDRPRFLLAIKSSEP